MESDPNEIIEIYRKRWEIELLFKHGTQEYNLALGERRARAAYEYLVMLGVNPDQMEMISFGKERPAVEGTGPAVWAKNRRDDFRVIAK